MMENMPPEIRQKLAEKIPALLDGLRKLTLDETRNVILRACLDEAESWRPRKDLSPFEAAVVEGLIADRDWILREYAASVARRRELVQNAFALASDLLAVAGVWAVRFLLATLEAKNRDKES